MTSVRWKNQLRFERIYVIILTNYLPLFKEYKWKCNYPFRAWSYDSINHHFSTIPLIISTIYYLPLTRILCVYVCECVCVKKSLIWSEIFSSHINNNYVTLLLLRRKSKQNIKIYERKRHLEITFVFFFKMNFGKFWVCTGYTAKAITK